MTMSRGINKPRHTWTNAERQLLRDRYADTKSEVLAQQIGVPVHSVYQQAYALGLAKSEAFMASVEACRLRRGDNIGAEYRFKPGQVPANKGVKGLTGVQEACRANQFKPGDVPHTWVPVGTYRVSKDGQLEVKFADEPGPPKMRWMPVSRKVWIEANGPIPPGMVVAFRPGMHTTVAAEITPDRLELLSKADVLERNRWQHLPPELRQIVTLRASLTRAINDRRKDKQP
ncbi:MAG: hypothetical protein RL375_3496 [Pseudomonadota bacterium]|jgi:hypothetical protein